MKLLMILAPSMMLVYIDKIVQENIIVKKSCHQSKPGDEDNLNRFVIEESEISENTSSGEESDDDDHSMMTLGICDDWLHQGSTISMTEHAALVYGYSVRDITDNCSRQSTNDLLKLIQLHMPVVNRGALSYSVLSWFLLFVVVWSNVFLISFQIFQYILIDCLKKKIK